MHYRLDLCGKGSGAGVVFDYWNVLTIPQAMVLRHYPAGPAAAVAEPAAVARLYELLLAYEPMYAMAPVEGVFGAVARALGVLAGALGRYEDAERHLDVAIDIERRMGAPPWLAHAQHDLAAIRVARGDPDRAGAPLADALRTYRELGMETWAARASELARR